jgi:hypothetical protein
MNFAAADCHRKTALAMQQCGLVRRSKPQPICGGTNQASRMRDNTASAAQSYRAIFQQN